MRTKQTMYTEPLLGQRWVEDLCLVWERVIDYYTFSFAKLPPPPGLHLTTRFVLYYRIKHYHLK